MALKRTLLLEIIYNLRGANKSSDDGVVSSPSKTGAASASWKTIAIRQRAKKKRILNGKVSVLPGPLL
jgi:hypothetical protein